MARRVFFSFHYDRDVRRIVQVRNSWVVRRESEAQPFYDKAEFEEAKKRAGGIEKWIEQQLSDPAITPMVWVVAQEVGVDYGRWVRLYQSRFFKEEFPEDNERFQNVTYTDAVMEDRERSLAAMREQMFSDNAFIAAVFIGGMGGIVDEYELFHQMQPKAAIIPVVSTGGAVLKIAERVNQVSPDLKNDLDYVALFHRHLDISVREERFRRPEDQPIEVEQRYWRRPETKL